MDTNKILPCPFCGQQDAFVEQLDSDASVVICQASIDEYSACLARGPVGVQECELEDQPGHDAAVREWNRRSSIAGAVQACEQFEAAYVEEMVRRAGEGFRSSAERMLTYRKENGDYELAPVSNAFWAWHASRAVVVVELPPKWNDATNSNKQAWDCGIHDARMAIEAQGLRVKS